MTPEHARRLVGKWLKEPSGVELNRDAVASLCEEYDHLISDEDQRQMGIGAGMMIAVIIGMVVGVLVGLDIVHHTANREEPQSISQGRDVRFGIPEIPRR